jgi:hypothetical protein
MPGGRVVDRRVPRYPAADEPAAEAQPAAETEADPALRRRYPSMFEAEIRPTEPDPAPETEPTAPAQAGESGEASSLPEAYRDLPAPEGLEVDAAALAAVAPDLQRLGVSRQQAAGLVGVLAKLEGEADKYLDKVAADWIGAVLLEQNDEWQLQHRYMQLEAMAELLQPSTDEDPLRLPPKAA